MENEIKIISSEIIKPSSPTPESLQKLQFTFLDQAVAQAFVPFVYFYSSNPQLPNSDKTAHLKKSLSETLSIFYPVAGRLVDNLYVDCNDAGIPFAEAVADCDLSQVITNPDINKIRKALFYKLDGPQLLFLAVKVTYFRCGGMAVGILLSHKIADAYSIVMFVNSWAAVARNGGGGVPSPKFNAAAYFPPGDILLNEILDQDVVDIPSKTFTFSSEKIALLQERYSAATGGRRPSRVEVVTAYLSTRFSSATGMEIDPAKTFLLYHPVNLRSRIKPPMLEYCFGNLSWNAMARPAAGDGGVEVVQKLREAKKPLLEGYVPQVKDLSELVGTGETTYFCVSSICGFPMYEADFRWGKPVWVVYAGFQLRNGTIIADTRNGGGIEAIITLSKQDMEKFEFDLECD